MGMIKIQTLGSFESDSFETCAEEGGHVAALRRAVNYLTGRLGEAVKKDAMLAKDGIDPPTSPLGEDKA